MIDRFGQYLTVQEEGRRDSDGLRKGQEGIRKKIFEFGQMVVRCGLGWDVFGFFEVVVSVHRLRWSVKSTWVRMVGA